jgi:hypothetical protein
MRNQQAAFVSLRRSAMAGLRFRSCTGFGALRIRAFARNNECGSPAASIRGEADSIIVGFVQILVAARLRFAAERKASPGRPSQSVQPRRIETVSVLLKTISVSPCGPDSQVIAL